MRFEKELVSDNCRIVLMHFNDKMFVALRVVFFIVLFGISNCAVFVRPIHYCNNKKKIIIHIVMIVFGVRAFSDWADHDMRIVNQSVES